SRRSRKSGSKICAVAPTSTSACDRCFDRDVPDRDLPACEDCGACCWSPDTRWIAVFEADARRMDAPAVALTAVIDGRRYLRMEGGRCAALRGTRCAIYPMRPDACRWLERGS